MPTGLEQIRAIRAAEKRKKRRQMAFAVAVLAAVAFAFLCIGERDMPHYSPVYVVRSIAVYIRYRVSAAGVSPDARNAMVTALYQSLGSGWAIVAGRVQNLLLIGIAGAALALSGTVYQTSMRNPMAVPTMLGVSSGVSMAQMILVLLYGASAYYMPVQRYALSYGLSIGVLLVILASAGVVGRGHVSVADLLIVGTIANRMFQIAMNYLQTQMDDETLEIYQEFSQNAMDYYNSFSDIGVLLIISAAVMMPLILMRFAFNVVSFDDEDAHAVGVKSKALRLYGIIAGGVLTATAMIHAGNVGMLATVVPLLCRYRYGADFRDLLWASALWGGVVLVISNIVRGYTYILDYQIPLGNIVSLLAVPLLIWIISRHSTIFSSMERQ